MKVDMEFTSLSCLIDLVSRAEMKLEVDNEHINVYSLVLAFEKHTVHDNQE